MIASLALVMAAATVSAEKLTISKGTVSVLNSDTLPGNLLPNFLFMQGSIEGGSVGVKIGGGRGDPRPFSPDDSCGDDIFDNAMEDMRSPQLPYLTQDLWNCERRQEEIPVWKYESKDLSVSVTPQFAKVWGIYDKTRDREWLYNAKAHQPANIGALKSWAAGGSEWNWSPGIIGHSAFAETQNYLARVETERGDILRMYEFDRYNSTVWQVDMAIVNGSFVTHPRITNPTEAPLRGYWWTSTAVRSAASTRVLTPATHLAQTSRDPMRYADWPFFADAIENASFTGYQGNSVGADMSYIQNHQIGDMFLRIPEDGVYTPYIGHTEDDGFVLIHGHPLNGTKFYTWGQSGPGRFMQDFLAGGGKRQGDYAELQVGVAPTQMQDFPVPANSIKEWTEWFKGFYGDVETLYGDYDGALSLVDTWMKTPGDGMPQEVVSDWDDFFERHATDAPAEVLVRGQPWGALEEMRRGQPLAPGLHFQLPVNDGTAESEAQYLEAKPWVELLNHGTFSKETLTVLPTSYQTTDPWHKLIQESVEGHGATWLHHMYLGINLAERGNIDEPREHFTKALELKPNPVSARCLAVLSATQEEAWPHYENAWNILHSDWTKDASYDRLTANLATEMLNFLQQAEWWDSMQAFLEAVPEKHRGLDAYLTTQIKVNLHNAEYDAAAETLGKECFPTYAKMRSDLMDMWNQAQEGIAQQKKGHDAKLTNVEKHRARVQNPVPENIGCQYASEYCSTYW